MQDIKFCMASYLMYRYLYDKNKSFYLDRDANIVDIGFQRTPVKTAADLLKVVKEMVEAETGKGTAALALSGGIDSAILAKFMPEGSQAYTFRCIVPGREVTDESKKAAHWASLCGLHHEVIDIYWEDIVNVCDKLMEYKGAPIHSIECQIYIAACRAKDAGYEKFIFGEIADCIYGGLNGLLAKDWQYSEFVDRYTYIMPYRVLYDPVMPLNPYEEYADDGYIDAYGFINRYFRQESLGSYYNACETAGIDFVAPYSRTFLDEPVNYDRIRSGDTKYIIREAFRMLYPDEDMPAKIPMPRPTDEWLAGWSGPRRKEFIPHCTDGMTGDQKWMVWCLERFLNNCM